MERMLIAAASSLLMCACAAPGLQPPLAGGVRQTQATVVMPVEPRQRAFQEEWGFADAVVVGGAIYLSGVVVDKRPGDADLTVSYERAYRRIADILARSGASWDDVVDISSFHTDADAQIESMVAVHKRYVKAPYPAWTAIGGTQILGGGITEIKVIARQPAGRS